MAAALPKAEKKRQIRNILNSPTLRGSLRREVLHMEKPSQKLFFTALKLRQLWLCRLLLWYKMQTS